jgi:hypothetical protein
MSFANLHFSLIFIHVSHPLYMQAQSTGSNGYRGLWTDSRNIYRARHVDFVLRNIQLEIRIELMV